MRPRRLWLENFTSYRGQVEVDFSDLDLFAITGPNGAGKSSLLEAMVYALYGRAPRVDTEVRQLITQGADSLRVALEFECEGRLFRIIRSTGRRAVVQLEEMTPAGAWQPRADRAREAEEIVHRLVGLDYDAFVRAIVLPQGRFQELLVGDPQKRNRLLDELLRLDIYKEVMRRANELARTSKGEAESIDLRLRTELAEATEEKRGLLRQRRLALAQARAVIAERQRRLEQARDLASALQDALRRRHEALSRLDALHQEMEGARQALSTWEEQERETNEALARLRQELASFHVDQERLMVLAQATQLVRAALEALERRRGLQARLEAIQAELAAARQRAQAARRLAAQAQQAWQEAEKAAEEAQKEWNEASARLREASPLVRQFQDKAQELEALRAGLEERAAALREAQSRHRQAEEAAHQMWEALQEASARWEEAQRLHSASLLRRGLRQGEECPVCGQLVLRLPPLEEPPDLEASRHRLLRAREEEQAAQERLREAESALADARRAWKEGQARLEQVEGELEGVRRRLLALLGPQLAPEEAERHLREALAQAQRRWEEARRARDQARASLERARDEEQTAQVALARLEADAQALCRQIEEAEEALTGHGADLSRLLQQRWPLATERHRVAREAEERGLPLEAVLAPLLEGEMAEAMEAAQRRERLASEERELARQAEEVKGMVVQARSHLLRLEAEASRLREEAAEAQRACTDLAARLKALSQEAGWDSLTAAVDRGEDPVPVIAALDRELREKRDDLAREIGALETQLERLERDIQVARDLRRRKEELEGQARLAGELGRLLQSDRFQKFLRDEALRVLAEDASRHLYELTRGRYTLSVQERGFYVADAWLGGQERPAHLLSGAETFLASLSLALALADRVPHMAHGERRPLESLFIDEGFGTLDEDNLDLVASALEVLCSGGRMVGIVTHLTALAERMPARLRVQPSRGGSTVVKEW